MLIEWIEAAAPRSKRNRRKNNHISIASPCPCPQQCDDLDHSTVAAIPASTIEEDEAVEEAEMVRNLFTTADPQKAEELRKVQEDERKKRAEIEKEIAEMGPENESFLHRSWIGF